MGRIWVIGNGPTLRNVNMDMLIGETTIATNKIHLIYSSTDWRPTHYVKVDYVAGEPWYDETFAHIRAGEQCLLWDAFRFGADKYDGNYEYIKTGFGDGFDNVRYIPRCEHTAHGTGAWHFPEICTGCNSILPMIQWAVQLGASEIYLLGCDGNYEPGKDHFTENYYEKWDDTYKARCNEKTRLAHEIARAGCKIPTHLCTKGSAYKEIWPFVDYREVLNG